MATDRYYPVIDEKNLNIISRLYAADSGYFEDAECPYGPMTKEVFKKTGAHHDFDTHGSVDIPETDEIIKQINGLSNQLKNYGKDIQSSDTTTASDRNTYFRLSVTLLEKLIDIKEKAVRIANYEIFTSTVLDIMDKELNPDQRQEITSRLKDLMGQPGTAGSRENGTEKDNSDGEVSS